MYNVMYTFNFGQRKDLYGEYPTQLNDLSQHGYKELSIYGLPDYAINIEGQVIDLYTGCERTTQFDNNDTESSPHVIVRRNGFPIYVDIASTVAQMFWDTPDNMIYGPYEEIIREYREWNLLSCNDKWDLRDLFPMYGLKHHVFDRFGNVWSCHTRKIYKLKPRRDRDGYLDYSLAQINGGRKHIRAHRIACTAFHPGVPEEYKHKFTSTEEMVVDHINGIRDCNIASNLRWVDVCENNHSSMRKLYPNSKIMQTELIEQICKDLKQGISPAKIEEQYGVNSGCVWSIRNGRLRKDVSQKYMPFPELNSDELELQATFKKMFEMHSVLGASTNEIAETTGYSAATVVNILNGITHAYLTEELRQQYPVYFAKTKRTTLEDIDYMFRRRYVDGCTNQQIADELGRPRTVVDSVFSGSQRLGVIEQMREKYGVDYKKRELYNWDEDLLEELFILKYKQGMTTPQISERKNIHRSTVYRIISGMQYPEFYQKMEAKYGPFPKGRTL